MFQGIVQMEYGLSQDIIEIYSYHSGFPRFEWYTIATKFMIQMSMKLFIATLLTLLLNTLV